MGVVKAILMVAFVIICVLLVLLVMIQNDEGGGLGGLLSGSGSAAFGSHSASVISKTTFVLVVLFILDAFFIARFASFRLHHSSAPAAPNPIAAAIQNTAIGEQHSRRFFLSLQSIIISDTSFLPYYPRCAARLCAGLLLDKKRLYDIIRLKSL